MYKAKKKDGGVLYRWKIHTVDLDDVHLEQIKNLFPDAITNPAKILTGRICARPLPGFRLDDWLRASWLVSVDLEAGIIETQNTIYHLDPEESPEPDIGPQIMAGAYYNVFSGCYILDGEKLPNEWNPGAQSKVKLN
ncbi:MAG: hypothetical protein GY710_21215 [Desulfobacteraceae bacterium]|nr:hypothetical protein [Desulfobacteraceae bacterium]